MLSENIIDKRADVTVRYMEWAMATLEKAETPNEDISTIAADLSKFMAQSFELETSRSMANQLQSFMKRMESKGFDLGKLD